MFYQEYKPNPALSPFVKCIWVLESDEISREPSREKVLPDGCTELIFHFGDHFRQYFTDGSDVIQPRSFIFGQIKQFIEVGAAGKSGIVAVRFFPGGAWPFFQIPMHELNHKATSIQDLFGKTGRELEERILNAPDNSARLDIVQNFLLARLSRSRSREDTVASFCVQKIFVSNGQVSIRDLSDALSLSKRCIEQKFNASIGISPKLLARIVRFQNVFKSVREQKFGTLTELAYASGYYDQAHFIKDFKAFSGINPKRFFADDHPMSDFFINGAE